MEAVPLTSAQRFIYETLNRLGPRPSLQLAACLRISGPVDAERFERAARELVSRHPVLCSLVSLRDGDPVQRQGSPVSCFEVIDIQGDDPGEQADALLSARADRPFNLYEENPFRVVLARVSSEEAFLMLLGHHIYLDGMALQTLVAEYVQLFLLGPAHVREPEWDSGERSFRAWAILQDERLHNGSLLPGAQYWLSYLDGVDPALRLPERGPDPAVQSMSWMPFGLTDDEFRVFASRAQRLRATHFALATTAIFQALRQATAQDELVVSMVMNTRRPPFQRTVGDFAGLVLLRQFERNGGLGDDAIRAVSRDVLKAVQHYVSYSIFLDQLDWLRKRRAAGLSMAEVTVNYVPMRADLPRPGAAGEHEISPFNLTKRVVPAEIAYHGLLLRFEFRPRNDALQGVLGYESAVISPQLAGAIAASLVAGLTVPA